MEPVSQTAMPPPTASLASPEAVLLLTVLSTTVSAPHVSIPPPLAYANWHGPSGQMGPKGTVSVGPTRLPVISLFLIVTAAPPLKSAFGGTSIPPPVATTLGASTQAIDNGLVCVTPPVTVTPSMTTVGSVAAPNVPMVMTGPPPLMIVRPAPAPMSLTLTSTVIPPA